MLVAFPAPVLSVTADAVRELEGSEALSGLWTLFTKCKESLKDGRRLENISWRLWYRELMLAGPPSEKKKHSVERDGDGDYRPLTPTLDMDERASLPPIPIHPSIPLTRRPSSIRRSGSVNQGTSMSVGKIICDMLPPTYKPSTRSGIATLSISPSNTTSGALPAANMGTTPATNPAVSEPRSVRYNLSILPLLPLPEPTTTREAVISAAKSLPTPAMEDVKGGYVSSGTVAESATTISSSATTPSFVNEATLGQSVYAGPPSPSLSDVYAHAHPGEALPMQLQLASAQSSSIMPAMALVSQPPSSTSPLPSSTSTLSIPLPPSIPPPSTQISIQTPTPRTPPPPTLVVVDPTPNPTPHPTPPATPAPVLLGAERRVSGQYLALPGRAGTPLRAAGGGERMSVVDERKDEVEGRIGEDVVEIPDKDADSNNKSYQHHQKYNSTSSTSSRASSSVSVVTGTTGVTSASASEVDVDEHHGTKVVDKEESLSSQAGDCASPLPATSSPKSTSTSVHSQSPKSQSHSYSHLRSLTTTTTTATTTTTTTRARALQPAPSTAITRRASSGGSRSRSRPSLSISGASTSAKSKSRSRSRDAGPGVLALGMGMTKKVGGRGKLGGGVSRGKIAGGKGLSRKGVGEGEQGQEEEEREEREALNVRAEREYLARMKEMEVIQQQQREGEREREREKRSALFNIGSNSDNGSKSAGSGSDASGLVGGVQGAYDLVQGGAAWNGKGKGKEREGDKAHQKEVDEFRAKQKEREEAVAANLALAAQQLARMGKPLLPAQLAAPLLPQQLAAPLLPQQQRRTIVLATSESDYETDSDEDEDGSWSSEEMSGDENGHQVEVSTKPVVPPPPPPAPAPAPAPPIVHRIAPIQKTVSNQTNTRTRPISRAQIHRAQAQANTQAIMEKAAAEAQRQRDMFAKLPVTSFQNIERGGGPSRTRSAGLLTQLLNPPLEIFPVNHPYRRGYSSGEIRVGQQQQGQGQQQQQQRAGPSSNASSGPARAPGGIKVSKSAAALPISSQVQVGSVYGRGVALAAMPTVGPVVNGNGNANHNGGYRPKGPPQGQELEDDSGSEDEANAGIQVSKSVAQERLKALAQRRGIVTHAKQRSMGGRLTTLDDNVVPPWLNGGPQPGPSTAAYGQLRRQVSDRRPYPEEQPPTPTPIPVGHPYNLPPPAAPSTPRTTRRQMLQTEMSESLRRNLLWERQVSKVNLVGYRASTNGGGRGNVLGGLKPLTTTPSMVQLRAKGEVAGNGNGAAGPSNADQTQPSDRDRRGSGGEAEEREERRRLAMARNKSWADDYHFKGW